MDKMTNKMALNYVLDNCEVPADVREKLAKMLEQVEKKGNVIHKPTANQAQNDGFKTAILNTLSSGTAMTVTEIMKATPELDGISNQRTSAIIRQMVLDGSVIREEVKGKAYFRQAE